MPDVNIKLKGHFSYRTGPADGTSFHAYSPLGEVSTIALAVITEPGLRLFASQKLERFTNDRDRDPLEEYYIEDEGNWRVGKQFLPFGAGALFRESVPAVRSDTSFSFYEIPVVVAACDGGTGKQRGIVLRAGGRLGFSAAIGQRFGAASTSFALVRHPENVIPGEGFEQVFGIDYFRPVGNTIFRMEAVRLSRPSTPQDIPDSIFDFSVQYVPSKTRSYTIGLTHSDAQRADYIRLIATLKATANLSIVPMIRYRNGLLYDFSIGLTVNF